MTYPRYQPTPGDYVVPQNWQDYTAEDHSIWDILWAQQTALLPKLAVPEFLVGLDMLRLDRPGIPDFEAINAKLHPATGWQVVAVPGLVPDACFFEHLANRRFPAGRFIRTRAQLDYLQEPDVFHDVFGHVPLLAHRVFADYMQAYGAGGLRSLGFDALDHLARLYWYTVEFGLIKTSEGLKIYGAGILSSRTESLYALDDASPNRIAFNLLRVMQTRYRIDDFQQSYFVIEDFEDLLNQTLRSDFAPLYHQLEKLADLQPADLCPQDLLLHKGSQNYAMHQARALSGQLHHSIS
jgi:phenylalanine-4-hydroxylase